MDQLCESAPLVAKQMKRCQSAAEKVQMSAAAQRTILSRDDAELTWKKKGEERTFVKGSRPQSAKIRPQSAKPVKKNPGTSVGSTPVPVGGGPAAVRARKMNQQVAKMGRPQTAPVRGRRKKKESALENEMDDWYNTLKKNGLLGSQAEKPNPKHCSVSKKYLMQKLNRQKVEDEKMLLLTQSEQEQYERGCIARMAEATRWAASLGLGKKYTPIYSKFGATSPLGGSHDRHSASQSFLEKGELRCEVVNKDDSKSSIISCELFEREHAKLLHRHRKMVLEGENNAATNVTQALMNANHFSSSSKGQAKLKSVRNTLTRNGTDTQLDLDKNPVRMGRKTTNSNGDSEIDGELRAVFEETQNLCKILEAQATLLQANGWNIF